MRIGIDATISFTSRPTGLGIYTINIVNELAKIHDDVIVWTVNDASFEIDKCKLRKVMQPLRYTGAKLFQIRPLWLDFFFARQLRKEKVDVLFSTVPSAVTSAPVPHVITVHDLIPLTFPGESPWPVCWNYRHRVPKILGNASALIAISEYTKKDLVRCCGIDGKKIATVYNGYDDRLFRPVIAPEVLGKYGLEAGNYILYVGNASPRKNLKNLVRAFSSVKGNMPHKLVICGAKTTRERKELNKLVADCDVGGRLIMLDYVPYHELPIIYSGATLFVYLSLYEGFGLPVLEAMACGTAVLASDTTSIPEVSGNAAVLVDPSDHNAIAAAMSAIIPDMARRERMSEMGRERSREFSWKRSAERIIDILQTVVTTISDSSESA